MDLDRPDGPTPGFVLPFPLKRAEVYKKEFQLPLLRVSFSKMEDAFAVGVWFIRCDESEVYWVFHGISGETSATLEKKVREHGGIRIPKGSEGKMVEVAEEVCGKQRTYPNQA
ncbi:hypothetical protein [Oceanithermus sp.]